LSRRSESSCGAYATITDRRLRGARTHSVVLDLRVNGGAHAVNAEVGRSLAETLREDLGLTGTKIACGEGHCGACTVLVDGVPTLSCITLVHTVEGREVTTIEGLRDHPLVEAFVRCDAVQCGFCTPGQIVSASALVAADPSPSDELIRHAMSGNLCRCGTYPKIEEAIRTWRG
jgi:aerobic-type carbon monoxide dehydrogenase small subunit (CoxS/CutS family)